IGSGAGGAGAAGLAALTRGANMPLWAFFGGVSTSLETDMTVTTGSVEEAAADARAISARGIRTIKIKIGSGDLALDLARVAAVAEVAPKAPLIVDGNAAFSADDALQLAAQLDERNI